MDTETESVILTENAANRINAIVARQPGVSVLRLSVEGGGCSGFSYKFDLVAEAGADDLIVERSGARLAVDSVSLPLMAGAEVDFVDNLMGQAFTVKNPNATASCGCGTSFAV